jgi:hypothetical protein
VNLQLVSRSRNPGPIHPLPRTQFLVKWRVTLPILRLGVVATCTLPLSVIGRTSSMVPRQLAPYTQPRDSFGAPRDMLTHVRDRQPAGLHMRLIFKPFLLLAFRDTAFSLSGCILEILHRRWSSKKKKNHFAPQKRHPLLLGNLNYESPHSALPNGDLVSAANLPHCLITHSCAPAKARTAAPAASAGCRICHGLTPFVLRRRCSASCARLLEAFAVNKGHRRWSCW